VFRSRVETDLFCTGRELLGLVQRRCNRACGYDRVLGEMGSVCVLAPSPCSRLRSSDAEEMAENCFFLRRFSRGWPLVGAIVHLPTSSRGSSWGPVLLYKRLLAKRGSLSWNRGSAAAAASGWLT